MTTRLRSAALGVLAVCLFITGCSERRPEPSRPQPQAEPQPLIDPPTLAQFYNRPQIRMNPGPADLNAVKDAFRSCSSPLRRALEWTSYADTVVSYDISTYSTRPGDIHGLISLSATWSTAPPDPLQRAVTGLRSCHTPAQSATIPSALGTTRVVRFTGGHILGTLAAFRKENTVITIVVGRDPSTPAQRPSNTAVTSSERAIIDLAIRRAGLSTP